MSSSRLNWFARVVRAISLNGPLAGEPTAEVLYVLLLSLFTCLALDLVLVQPRTPALGANAGVVILGAFSYGTAIMFLRSGLLRPASFFYLVGTWLMWTIVIVWNGGIHSVGLVFYVAIPISAAWLLGFRAVLASGIVCLASALVLAILEIEGVRVPRIFPGTPIGIWVGLLTAITIAAVPAARVLHTLRKALAMAQERAAQLRESEGRFRDVANTAPLMIWTAGPDMRCTFVNRAWLDFTGRTLEEELGDGWTANVHPDDVAHGRAINSIAFEARRSVELEYRKRRADGEYRWVLGSGVPRFTPEGHFLGYIGTCVDITDLKRSRDEEVARQKLENVGALAGGIAHDFNNVLGAILVQADLGLEEIAAGVPPQEELESIRSVAIRGTGIGRQLMIYAGQESTISEPVDLSSLIEDMRELLKAAVSKHAVLQTELAPDMSPVLANPAQLRQVVMNLVTNASEAIAQRDGSIIISTRQVTAVVNLDRGSPSECIELKISDNGSGISREAQPKIFDSYFTTKPSGHGLGLAVVQRIVQNLGGAIQVDTELGRGTTFRILLPVAGGNVRPAHQQASSVRRDELECSGIILSVEDEPLLRVAVARMLRSKRLRVVEAADGTEALASIHEHKHDIALVLLDATLPGAPSREVLAEARRVRQDVKVIVVSAYGQNTVDASFPGMRIDAFLRKPYTFADLTSLITRVLSKEASETIAKTPATEP